MSTRREHLLQGLWSHPPEGHWDIYHELRDKIRDDPNELDNLTLLWVQGTWDQLAPIREAIAAGATEYPPCATREGYIEAVDLLVWWCDTGPFNIDATPFLDLVTAMDMADEQGWNISDPEGWRRIKIAENRATRLMARMINTSAVASHTNLQRRRRAPDESKLKPHQKAIVDTLRDVGHALKTEDLLAELSSRGLPSNSNAKMQFSILKQFGFLETAPGGYALPEWELKSQDKGQD
jgi:hypothetical protein